MSSRADSTPACPATAASSSFRQTLLWRLANPAYAQALETLGELLWDHVNELGQFGPLNPPTASITASELKAAAGELAYTAGYLRDVANELTASELTPREEKLSRRSAAWSRQVAKIADSIEEALKA